MSNGRSRIFIVLPVIFALLLPGCLIFGLFSGAKPKNAFEEDSISAYNGYLSKNPNTEDSPKYKTRLAELELTSVRTNLRPVFKKDADFFAEPGGQPMGKLSLHAQFILDSYKDGWFGVKATSIDVDYSKDNVEFFTLTFYTRKGKPQRFKINKEQGHFSIDEMAGISLVNTSSFEAHIKQHRKYRGGMKFCFFSQSPDTCDEGYEFYFDVKQFKEYYLLEKSQSQPETKLCKYKMTTSNFQHSDSITVDHGKKDIKAPDIEVKAHNGFIDVYFNGVNICRKEDSTYTSGYFFMSDSDAMTTFSITMNNATETFWVRQSDLAEIQTQAPKLTPRGGSLYAEYDQFVEDYNAYLNGEVTQGEFHNEYFTQLSVRSEEN